MNIKTIILIGSLVFFSGCESENIQEHERYQKFANSYLNTINVDGCEYLIYMGMGSQMMLTHKGNCTNSIHNHNHKHE
jgi:hypothetical protein